jgi:hypothetical protein
MRPCHHNTLFLFDGAVTILFKIIIIRKIYLNMAPIGHFSSRICFLFISLVFKNASFFFVQKLFLLTWGFWIDSKII